MAAIIIASIRRCRCRWLFQLRRYGFASPPEFRHISPLIDIDADDCCHLCRCHFAATGFRSRFRYMIAQIAADIFDADAFIFADYLIAFAVEDYY
jgi:hypothetical protein